ncbi:hypothetical protein [Chryseobacterium turcicum]|uniref:Uncharacterized protein n=1 Tax=Chryseobacterium turcicum TaxID=2898076 RepID=A0A9Q3V655_9FLAO|nr:hypothetical protein [Chryseobacterium turcicum]MCD1118921.1 hypothetical protein [Chryseobacterium turcicum]
MLPKEINLNPKTSKIIDSIFILKMGKKTLEVLQIFELKNGIITHGNIKYFVNDTLNSTTNDTFDSNGNNIESHTIHHFKNSNMTFRKELDNYGNMVSVAIEEDGRISHLKYKNIYRNNQLAESSLISEYSGKTINKTVLEYDSNGNLVKEKSKESESEYQYNQDKKVTLYKHIKNGVVGERIIYHYNNKLLTKMEWYENIISPNPMITEYAYNDKYQLVLEIQKEFASKTEYKNYNSYNNWQRKEQYSGGEMDRLTTRTFFDK